MAHVVRFRTSS